MNEKKEILLLHRKTVKRTQWEIPGGKVESTETAEQTAVREIKEELGVDVELSRKLGEEIFREEQYSMRYIWFLASIKSGKPYIAESEKYDGLEYFSLDRLHEMPDISPNTKNLITAITRGDIIL